MKWLVDSFSAKGKAHLYDADDPQASVCGCAVLMVNDDVEGPTSKDPHCKICESILSKHPDSLSVS